MSKKDLASSIREHAARAHVGPAKRDGLKQFTIRAGDVHKEMGFRDNRMPAVCHALKTREFLEQNQLHLVARSGPPSGQSSTVTYTYEFAAETPKAVPPDLSSFYALRGILRDAFAEVGGGEEFIRAERAAWNKRDDEPL